MSIFHDQNSLNKRYISGLSYKKSKVIFIKFVLVVGIFFILTGIVASVYIFDKQNKETVIVKETFKKSKNYDMYAEKLKYDDAKNKKVLYSQKVIVDENNKKSFSDITIKSTEKKETIKANKAYIEDKSTKYFIEGNVEYNNQGLKITSDKAIYDNDSGEVEAKGNFKIVIKEDEK